MKGQLASLAIAASVLIPIHAEATPETMTLSLLECLNPIRQFGCLMAIEEDAAIIRMYTIGEERISKGTAVAFPMSSNITDRILGIASPCFYRLDKINLAKAKVTFVPVCE